MKCPNCGAAMVPNYAYDPIVWKCPEDKTEVEGDGGTATP